ncbi:hypothetical protein LHYA1_G006082 [Lachnellula hyalina]|uniref:Uncharacterized protein n=1 Tax=Lachnellula hyalina TaxID=1316788 RepID=A0A8H8QYR4_9HELO|nr:uncharacterized protein LHYA1_G006082 [Lachnellula hyalina]TVY25214.1 hypothetical protein LHYA1_G006082 [Lachnellula hyalina]
MVITLSGTTIKKEFRRRNPAINTITTYYHFQEGGAAAIPHESNAIKEDQPLAGSRLGREASVK